MERAKHVIGRAQVRRCANRIPAVSAFSLGDLERTPYRNLLEGFAFDRVHSTVLLTSKLKLYRCGTSRGV